MNIAGIALYNVAIIAALAEMAIAGKRASPSFEIEFPIWADIGIWPETYIEVIIICGPQPGMNPIIIAIKGINGPKYLSDSKTKPLVDKSISS